MAKGMIVEFSTPRGAASGYVMGMIHGKGRPGVVVLHETLGIGAHVRDIVNRLAHEGYDALAPDLAYCASPAVAAEPTAATHVVDWGAAMADVAATIAYLQQADHRTLIGLVGYGVGGALAIMAAHHAGVAAYVSFSGFPPAGHAFDAIAAPGLLFFGERDRDFPRADATAFVRRQTGAGISTELFACPNAGHAFFDGRAHRVEPHAGAPQSSRQRPHLRHGVSRHWATLGTGLETRPRFTWRVKRYGDGKS
jgi:carboxymethylenebutenolidase